MQEIKIFHDAIKDIPAMALKIKAENKKIIGHLCAYTPEEIIHAAGFRSEEHTSELQSR